MSRQCNFQIIGGEATALYRIVTGFNGQKTTETEGIMDLPLTGNPNLIAFIEDFLIVSRGSEKRIPDVKGFEKIG